MSSASDVFDLSGKVGLITGGNGGVDHHILLVEEKGVEYEYDAIYGPRLPADDYPALRAEFFGD